MVPVPCSAAMGVILLCGWCVNVYDVLCLPFPPSFHDVLISDSACWGTVPLIFFGRSLRFYYGEYNSIVLCSRLCLVSLSSHPFHLFIPIQSQHLWYSQPLIVLLFRTSRTSFESNSLYPFLPNHRSRMSHLIPVR